MTTEYQGPTQEEINELNAQQEAEAKLIAEIDRAKLNHAYGNCRLCFRPTIQRATSAFGRIAVEPGNNPSESFRTKDPRTPKMDESVYFRLLNFDPLVDVPHREKCGG